MFKQSIRTITRISGALILVISMTACLGGKAKDKDPKTNMEKVSYAIGNQIGGNLKSQDIKVDIAMLAQAINEQLAGKKSRLTPQQMQEAMMDMQKERMDSRKKKGEANKISGTTFLAENKKKEGFKTTDSGLQYKVITAGAGKKPKASDVVKVHYRGKLIDGTEFDSSYKRNKPAQFPVGGVIKGWTEALKMMKIGSKWELVIPADLAYGEMGRPSIPPNSVLIFEVELLEIVNKNSKKKKK